VSGPRIALSYTAYAEHVSMKNAQLKKMLLKLSESPNLLYKIEQIKLPDSQSGWYGVMTYSKKIYEVYTAQLHCRGLTSLGDESDSYPCIVYKAQWSTCTDDTLHVYTREECRGRRYGCMLLKAAIEHCIEKKWRVSASTDLSSIEAVFRGTGLKQNGDRYWQWDQPDSLSRL
jgi:hypothetical protein